MSICKRYYLNALFDLELGGYPVDAVKRSAAEMTTLFLPLMQAEDTVVLDVGLPDTHAAFLRSCGFTTPDTATSERMNSGSSTEMAWGWNREAVVRLGARDGFAEAPLLDIVRDVNCRRFCSEIGLREGFGVPGSRFCEVSDSFEAAVEALRDNYPLVIKPAFGGAGFGLRVVHAADSLMQERRLIDSYLQHGGLVVEPWCERLADLSTSIDINRDGCLGRVIFQRPWVNRYGAFFGMYCEDDDPHIVPWMADLEKTTLQLAKAAAARGYFGPFGIDHFTYRDGNGVERLASGIEVNARFTMGMLAQKYRQLIAPHQHTLLRFIGQKKCRLPDTMNEWSRQCENVIPFDAQTGSGIIPITPMRIRYGGKWIQPQRSAFFITGTSMEQVERFDRSLRSGVLPVGNIE